MTESVEHCSAAVTDEDMNVRIFKTPTQLVLPRIYYNSRGDKEYIPVCSLENKPIFGMKFDSLGDGIAFYYKYANKCGFKARFSTTKVDKNKVGSSNGKGVTVTKYLLCSKDGHEQDELNRLNKFEPQLLTHLHLEKQAAVIYSRAIFYDFQEECQEACLSCGVNESCSSLYGDVVEFSVIVDHEKRKNFDVNFDLTTYECSCTCKMFESQGIDILKKASAINVVLDDASKYDKKKQLVSKNPS
uniref:Protein FAR1-RELATED SEQUENCE n=1 Tax=Chenopodium quinoa TaxID=63459 RepID=A0A803N103_CHEQI